MRRALLALALIVAACQSPPTDKGTPGAPSPPPSLALSSAGCGQVIATDFLLGADLSCRGDALVVGADGITLDLGGHTITGPGKGQRNWPNPNFDSVGVKLQGRARVTVRNGVVSAFSTGVLADQSREILIEKIGARLSYYGVYLNETTNSAVRGAEISQNTYGLHLQRSNDNQILDNRLVRQEYASPGGYGVYLFGSRRNRLIGNTVASNLNWGIWFSDSRENVIFRNNVIANNPQVSDNVGANSWFDPDKKEGNYWGDYAGRDGDGDGIGDTPYVIDGPARQQDSYPFAKQDGWLTKRSQTIDHAGALPAPKERRDVRLIALAGGSLVGAAPDAAQVTDLGVRASSIAIAPDQRTLYAREGSVLAVMDGVSGDVRAPRYSVEVPGVLVANRDGRHAMVVGPQGALSVDTTRLDRKMYRYDQDARDVAPSWKHNILFVSTERGVDLFYVGRGSGSVPYTIPLDGPGGPLAMNRSGTRLYAVARGAGLIDVIDTEQYVVVDRIRTAWEPVALVVAPDESTLYVAAKEGVTAIDLATHLQRGATFFSGTPVDMGISPNSDQLYVALDGAERGIAVVSTTDLRRAHFVRVDAPLQRLVVASY